MAKTLVSLRPAVLHGGDRVSTQAAEKALQGHSPYSRLRVGSIFPNRVSEQIGWVAVGGLSQFVQVRKPPSRRAKFRAPNLASLQ